MAKGNGHAGRWIRSWHFKERDPEVDVFQTLYQKQGIKEDDLAAMSGLATGTVKNLFSGKTRKPQHLTYYKLAIAMGHRYTLTKELVPNYEVEVPKAKEERREYRSWLRKRKERAARRAAE